MIIRHLDQIIGSDADVKAPTWAARRLLLKKDGMGFSLHDTVIYAGTETHIWYKNHLEAVYCISGEGEIEEIATGRKHAIKPGMMYALNEHDNHFLRATTELRLICVFNPPLTGKEVHDAEGVYPLVVEDAPAGA